MKNLVILFSVFAMLLTNSLLASKDIEVKFLSHDTVNDTETFMLYQTDTSYITEGQEVVVGNSVVQQDAYSVTKITVLDTVALNNAKKVEARYFWVEKLLIKAYKNANHMVVEDHHNKTEYTDVFQTRRYTDDSIFTYQMIYDPFTKMVHADVVVTFSQEYSNTNIGLIMTAIIFLLISFITWFNLHEGSIQSKLENSKYKLFRGLYTFLDLSTVGAWFSIAILWIVLLAEFGHLFACIILVAAFSLEKLLKWMKARELKRKKQMSLS